MTYETVAAMSDAAGASRAVAGAIAANPVALVIPCHRVIRKSGALGGYRWGTARKLGLLSREPAGRAERRTCCRVTAKGCFARGGRY